MFSCKDATTATRRPVTIALRAWTVLFLLTCFVGHAAGDVTWLGSVNPNPPPGGGDVNDTLVVGDDDDDDSDIRAWLRVDDGTVLQYNRLIIGDDEDFTGEVHVEGNFLEGIDTQFNFDGGALGGGPTVQVGNDGTGRLFIRGATMELFDSTSDMSIGHETTGIGHVTVSEPFALLTIADNLLVGDEGIGHLEVLNGALVRTLGTGTTDAITIGSQLTSFGTVLVDGPGSVLRTASNLVVGGLGVGTLTISNQGLVDVDNISTRTTTVGPLGRLELDGGTLIGLTTFVEGYLGGSGLVRGTVDFGANSFLEASAGDMLLFNDDVSNQGAATIDNGEVRFLAGFTNNAIGAEPAPGRISLENGTVRFSELLVNDGVISSAQGANNIHGEIVNQGTVVVASNTVATFYDAFTDNGGTVTVLPRGNALFLTDMMFTSMSTVLLTVGLEDMVDQTSSIGVGGLLTLAGELSVDVASDYTPTLGDSFQLITADGGIAGTFDTAMLPDIPGMLEYGLLYDPNAVRMEVRLETTSIDLPGDYNGDGIVDAADYTVWRDSLGQSGSGLAADGTGPGGTPDGVVDQLDYGLWVANFGQTTSPGSPSAADATAAIPEPASWFIALVAMVPLGIRRVRY